MRTQPRPSVHDLSFDTIADATDHTTATRVYHQLYRERRQTSSDLDELGATLDLADTVPLHRTQTTPGRMSTKERGSIVTRLVALLRGIGPSNPNMRNNRLREVCEELGLRDVAAVASSGNRRQSHLRCGHLGPSRAGGATGGRMVRAARVREQVDRAHLPGTRSAA